MWSAPGARASAATRRWRPECCEEARAGRARHSPAPVLVVARCPACLRGRESRHAPLEPASPSSGLSRPGCALAGRAARPGRPEGCDQGIPAPSSACPLPGSGLAAFLYRRVPLGGTCPIAPARPPFRPEADRIRRCDGSHRCDARAALLRMAPSVDEARGACPRMARRAGGAAHAIDPSALSCRAGRCRELGAAVNGVVPVPACRNTNLSGEETACRHCGGVSTARRDLRVEVVPCLALRSLERSRGMAYHPDPDPLAGFGSRRQDEEDGDAMSGPRIRSTTSRSTESERARTPAVTGRALALVRRSPRSPMSGRRLSLVPATVRSGVHSIAHRTLVRASSPSRGRGNRRGSGSGLRSCA